jgi:hypothetical protein
MMDLAQHSWFSANKRSNELEIVVCSTELGTAGAARFGIIVVAERWHVNCRPRASTDSLTPRWHFVFYFYPFDLLELLVWS